MNTSGYPLRSRGFSLIELLIVVAILALLMGILLPSFQRARVQARRTACLANLQQIGVAIKSYMHDSNDHLPVVQNLPSLGLGTEPPLPEALKIEVGKSRKVFNCPADRPGPYTTDPGTGPVVETRAQSYFETEGCSYEFNSFMSGRQLGRGRITEFLPLPELWIVKDYNHFHDKWGQPRMFNYLFADFHADSQWDIGGP